MTLSAGGELAAFLHREKVQVHRLSDGEKILAGDRLDSSTTSWMRWHSELPRLETGAFGRVETWELVFPTPLRILLDPFRTESVTATDRAIDDLAFSPDSRWIAVKEKGPHQSPEGFKGVLALINCRHLAKRGMSGTSP